MDVIDNASYIKIKIENKVGKMGHTKKKTYFRDNETLLLVGLGYARLG